MFCIFCFTGPFGDLLSCFDPPRLAKPQGVCNLWFRAWQSVPGAALQGPASESSEEDSLPVPAKSSSGGTRRRKKSSGKCAKRRQRDTSSSSTGVAAVRIWMVGHSIVHWASIRARESGLGPSLGLPHHVQPTSPIFTQNICEAYRTIGKTRLTKWLYEKTQCMVRPIYGGFPVKLRTFIGEPIPYDPNITAVELAKRAKIALENLRDKHQKRPGNILGALSE
ncbi:Hypothetical predicted protein [Podarcis lilfordi]|uniref:Uncharacterized protein n=1 Tax=Podarcis lilfordi TaxID=74358 RepID=A0AA35KL63_9SAUR|nr:Hypothetical predicted protein [Podarcis lilfordi]